jgi:hypothetical protein
MRLESGDCLVSNLQSPVTAVSLPLLPQQLDFSAKLVKIRPVFRRQNPDIFFFESIIKLQAESNTNRNGRKMNDNNPIPTHNFKVDDPNTYQLPSSQLYQRVSHLRWLVLVLGLTLVVVHLLLEEYVGWASLRHWELVEIAYGSTIAVVAWGFLTWLQRSVGQTKAAEYAAHRAHTEMSQTNQRLKFLIQVNHHLINIGDEEILIDRLLESFMQTVSAIGCSLIRFNEHGHALPVIYRGGLDPATFETWADHLSAAGVRQRCQA